MEEPLLSQYIDSQNAVEPANVVEQANTFKDNIVFQAKLFYINSAQKTKAKIDELGAKITSNKERIQFVDSIIADINAATNEKSELDISQNPKLQENLQKASKLGVKLKEGLLTFNPFERELLIDNLNIQIRSWNSESQTLTQRMEITSKSLERIMTILKDLNENTTRTIRTITANLAK